MDGISDMRSGSDADGVPVLDPSRNCWRIERAEQVALIVDAADYLRTMREAMINARRRIILVGWDFDTRIQLDRGRSLPGVPNILGDFIGWLADKEPALEIYLLSWDVGALKPLGRGSSLLTVARWAAHERIHRKYNSVHPA